MFARTQRFSHPYAHAIIDIFLTILWFAAFIGVLVWVKEGSEAAKDWKKGDKTCSTFGWGSTEACKLGQGVGGMGFFIW